MMDTRSVDATRVIYGKRFLIAALARERAATWRYLGRIYDRRAHLDTGIEEAALECEMITVLCHF
jgi:molybdopterin biosynthesis enzyme